MQREIQSAVYLYQRAVDAQDAIVVGVNEFASEQEVAVPIQRIDEALEGRQVEKIRALELRRGCLGSTGNRLRFRRGRTIRLTARESGYWPPLGGNFSNSLSIALSRFWVFFSGLLERVSLAMPRQTSCLLLPSYMSITSVPMGI